MKPLTNAPPFVQQRRLGHVKKPGYRLQIGETTSQTFGKYPQDPRYRGQTAEGRELNLEEARKGHWPMKYDWNQRPQIWIYQTKRNGTIGGPYP